MALMLCPGCRYPIPSWQHNGACKPVEDKVPMYRVRGSSLRWPKRVETVPDDAESVTENPPVTEIPSALPKRRGRPAKTESLTPAEKQRAYRERKKQ